MKKIIITLCIATTITAFWFVQKQLQQVKEEKKINKTVSTAKSSPDSSSAPKVKPARLIKSSDVILAKLPNSLEKIFNQKSSKKERIRCIQNLSNDLSEEEIGWLYSFLANDLNDSHYLFAKDEIMCKLENQLIRPEDYEETLAGIIENRQIDGDLRGYAVQHLRSAWSVKNVNKVFLEAIFWDSLNDYESDVAGTALLALNDVLKLSKKNEELTVLYSETERLVLDSSVHKPSRLTALSLILQNGKITQPVLDLANKIVSESSGYDTAFKVVAQKIIEKNKLY